MTCDQAATFQVGERSRGIYPAGLFTRTLADAVGPEVATELYLTDVKLTATQACEKRLVQAVASSVSRAQRLAYSLVYQHSSFPGTLNGALRELAGELPASERRSLAVAALAQARSLQAKAASSAPEVLFTPFEETGNRSNLRGAVQAAWSEAKLSTDDSHLDVPCWRKVTYSVVED